MNDKQRQGVPWDYLEAANRFLAGRTLDARHLRIAILDGDVVLYGRCPGCGEWALLDDDQLHGIVSTHHDVPGCSFHAVKDWWAEHTYFETAYTRDGEASAT